MEYMTTQRDKTFDLAIVDPPYGISVNVNMGRRRGDNPSSYHKFAGEDKESPGGDYFDELRRVSDNQIIWGANHFIDKFSFSANSPCWIMWDKGFSEKISFAQFELAWTSFKTVSTKFDKSPCDPYRIHPTQKPTKLYEWILMKYAEQGQRVLDTHLGSASSAIAAHYFGCDFVGCEIDNKYYDLAQNRFKNETSQIQMFT